MIRNNVEDVDDAIFFSDQELRDLLRVPRQGHHGRVKRDAVKVVALQRVPQHHSVVVAAAHDLVSML
jgi:hypothetical protein